MMNQTEIAAIRHVIARLKCATGGNESDAVRAALTNHNVRLYLDSWVTGALQCLLPETRDPKLAERLAVVHGPDYTIHPVPAVLVEQLENLGRFLSPAEKAATADPDTVTVALKISDQFCRDVLSTALHGGIGYWAQLDNTKAGNMVMHQGEHGPEYQEVTLIEFDESDDSEVSRKRIGPAQIREGIRLLLAGEASDRTTSSAPAPAYAESVLSAIKDDDTCNLDADDADVIIQMAYFGHIVYG